MTGYEAGIHLNNLVGFLRDDILTTVFFFLHTDFTGVICEFYSSLLHT